MRAFFVSWAVAISAWPAGAAASPSYPVAIASELALPCEPACTLCHTQPTGGFATVNTPFGLTVRMEHDLTCCDPVGLAELLDEIGEAEPDSDGDGVSDLDELRALTDPNSAQDADLACNAPSDNDGCTVGVPGAHPSRARSALFVTAVFVVVASAVRRRRFA